MVELRKYGPPVPAEVAQALGKRANIVSGGVTGQCQEPGRGAMRTRRDAPDYLAESKARRSPAGKIIHREKDQPRHVQERAARARRWHMQDTAASLAGWRLDRKNKRRLDRVADCLRKISDVAHDVGVGYVPASGSAHYQGLQTCGSVWHCPICAAKISEARRKQLARLVTAHTAAGGSVFMTTYTVRHKKTTDLEQLVGAMLAARRKMRMGRRGQALRESFGVVGTVSVLEVTWSPRHGWHPHVHELVFSSNPDMSPDDYERAARPAWKDAAAAVGLEMNAHGFQIDRTFGAVQDYIAKFGHEPEQKLPWGVESEMSKGHVKQARSKDGMSPFALLAAASDGLTWAAPLWQEYCQVFKGKKQLNYSKGLKALYGIEEETDEDLASGDESEASGAAVTLVELSPGQWDQVLEAHARGGLLELARTGRPGVVIAGLAEIGVEVEPVDMVGWRALCPDGPGEIGLIRPDRGAPGGWVCWLRPDVFGVERDAPYGRVYPLWSVEILGDGSRERAALLAEVEAVAEEKLSGVEDLVQGAWLVDLEATYERYKL